MSSAVDGSLHGDLHVYPFASGDRQAIVRDQYEALLEQYAPDEVLVLTQLIDPQETSRQLATIGTSIAAPAVERLTQVATEVLETDGDGAELLSENARIEILADYLDDYEWTAPYLQNAAGFESFQQDVGQLLLKADSQGGLNSASCESPALAEIAALGEAFQSYLAERGYIDPSTVLTRAAHALETMGQPASSLAVDDWELVLVTEFEECDQPKRRFLAALAGAADASIVGIAERDSRILSSWNETGSVTDLANGLSVTTHDRPAAAPESQQTAVARFLSTGHTPAEPPTDGSVEVIEAPTFDDQLRQVADEIERLSQTEEYSYEDCVIAFQDSEAPIGEAIRRLRRAGIPAATIAVNQLGDDPAVRELHRVAELCAAPDLDAALADHQSALPETDDTAGLIADLRDAPAPAAGLWRWVRHTQLKDRIASEYTELEARNQFAHIREAIDLAAFIEAAPELDASWQRYLTALERAFQYSASRYESIAPAREHGGVGIGTVYGIKSDAYRAVFLLNVTDEAYPFTPALTALFPRAQLREESEYPTLTDQSLADVRATFRPDPNDAGEPFFEYFAQLSRRLLGIGANAATDRLYFGVPREDQSSLGEYQQPSRFLDQVVETFEFVRPLETHERAELTSHGGISEFAVSRVDDTLEELRRAAVGGDQVDLDTYEQELAAIQELLDDPAAETIHRAIEARIDARHGRVRRE